MIDTEILEILGAEARDRITDIYSRMTGAGATPGEVQRVLVDQLTVSNTAAAIDGEALARQQLTDMGLDLAPDYARPGDTKASRLAALRSSDEERNRFTKAVATVMADDDQESIAQRLGRLALAEAIGAAQRQSADTMRGQRDVEGWTRQLDSDPCQLCQWWAREGRVWPASHTMPTHPGCACAQQWTVSKAAEVQSVSRSAQIASAKRAEGMKE